MEFGVFDHLDRGDLAFADHYEARLRLIEAYDRAGFYGYHLAEHHFTPLGVAPSPSIFLAAVAQRTRRLRFGPLVYAVPLHHPLRLIEEICMLDQLSRGRFEMGFGRGSSPIEITYYGENPERAQRLYAENLELILKGLTEPILDFHGEFNHFENLPMELTPFQKPYPPVWYGVHSPDSAERAARKGLNIVGNDVIPVIRLATDRFRAVWAEARPDQPLPKIGLSRFVVVGETDEAALAAARHAYPRWYRSFNHLYRRHGRSPVLGERSPDFDGLAAEGKGVAGTPERVAEFLCEQLDGAGANYCVCQLAFGDLSVEETQRSVALFAEAVMPALAEPPRGGRPR